MRLLVTNDDGIDSVFLHELVRALLAAGHSPYVVAPKTEQSWIGAAKSRARAVHATAADRGLGWVPENSRRGLRHASFVCKSTLATAPI